MPRFYQSLEARVKANVGMKELVDENHQLWHVY